MCRIYWFTNVTNVHDMNDSYMTILTENVNYNNEETCNEHSSTKSERTTNDEYNDEKA